MLDVKLQYDMVVSRHVDELQFNPNNPRDHKPKQIRLIADSIREFGFNQPILIDSASVVIAGHGRLMAAKHLGLTEVPTICLSHLTKAQVLAYGIADNRLTDLSAFERKRLATEFALILDYDTDYNLELTGFDGLAIELALDLNRAPTPSDCAEAPLPPNAAAVSQRGDFWTLGRHRLLCADATLWPSYDVLLGRQKARVSFLDPPFNVRINGHVSGGGRHKHREFVAASGEMDEATFIRFLTDALTNVARASVDGSVHFVCMDWRHQYELLTAARAAFDKQLNLCVWTKSNAGQGSLWRSQHELVGAFKKGRRAHINNIENGQHGRNRSNVWAYAGMTSFSAERDTLLAMHSTVKPLDLVADAILDVSRVGDIVLDSFGGSGTTMMAAERTERSARLMELDPLYVDVIVRRFEQATGIAAIDARGVPFKERQMLAAAGEA